MMRSLFSGVSGLKSHQTKMDVIGNNISNVNTTGFKGSRVVFTDVFSQQLSGPSGPQGSIGGTNEKAVGLGTGVGAIDLLFTDGSVQSTGKNTDLALTGNGLFIVKQGNESYYTRNGDFYFDAEGNYVMSGSGMFVQGWTEQLNAEGKTIDPTDVNMDKKVAAINSNGEPGIINIKAGKTMPPSKTTKADYIGNLDSGATSAITTTITVYDDQGFAYKIPIVFERAASVPSVTSTSGLGNKWIVGFPKTASTTATSGGGAPSTSGAFSTLTTSYTVKYNDREVGTVTLDSLMTMVFNNDGSFNTVTSAEPASATTAPATSAMPAFQLTFTVTNPPASIVSTSATSGAAPAAPASSGGFSTTLDIDVDDLTQYANESSLYGDTDGWASGVLKSVSFDKRGLITGVYTNGVRQYEGQVAVAQFTNASGLTKAGNSLYQASNNSGAANIKTATSLGVTITPSALEMSNVDVATEFAEMITTQRGFQSNSKIVTVGDEMLETLINMKR